MGKETLMTPRIDPAMKLAKVCPECGDELRIRENRLNGGQFIGCSGWPRCGHTEEIPETLRMQLAGAPTLFDDPDAEPIPMPGPAHPNVDHRPVVRCKSCGAAIVWGVTKNGKPCPYNVVGMKATEVSHFTTCPQAKGWSKR